MFMAETPDAALAAALHTARLWNEMASVGPTKRVVYPDGPNGSRAWVLAAGSYSARSRVGGKRIARA